MTDQSAATEQRPSAPAPRRPSIGRLVLYFAPFAIFAAIGAVLALKVVARETPAPGADTLIGSPAPALDLPLLNGDGRLERVALTETDGPVVVNFWASWCLPCRVEHPSLMELAESGKATVIGVAYKDEPQQSRALLKQLGNPFSAVGIDENGFAAVEWGVRGVPETYVLSSDGVIVYKHVGPIQNGDYQRLILPAIEKARQTTGQP